jgi:hypothetical protein
MFDKRRFLYLKSSTNVVLFEVKMFDKRRFLYLKSSMKVVLFDVKMFDKHRFPLPEVFDVVCGHRRVGDAIVDDGVDSYSHGITGEHLHTLISRFKKTFSSIKIVSLRRNYES